MAPSLLLEALTVYAVIFLFEIVDRTNFATVSLSGRHPPLQVWTGAAAAFVVSSAISVAIGSAVVVLLPAYLVWIKVVGGAVLVLFGLRELVQTEEAQAEKAERAVQPSLSPAKVRMTAFALILFLEMGDNTQILTFEFVANAGANPGWVVLVVIFLAATLALWSTAAVGAKAGQALSRRVPERELEKLLGTILIAVGALTILIALEPGLISWL